MVKIPTPSVIADDDLAAIRAHKATLLQRLQTRAEKTGDPAMQHILEAKPSDVHIEALSTQGCSKQTYRVTIGDYKAILSVFKPLEWHNRPRTTYANRLEFRRHLRAHGIPVPGKIGRPFELDTVIGKCELAEFTDGYTKNHGESLTDDEIKSIGDMLGRLHAASGFRPQPSVSGAISFIHDRIKGMKAYAGSVPRGFTHGDLAHGNIIFDNTTHKIAGVIDFERARNMRLVDELAYCLRSYTSDITPSDTGTYIAINPHKRKVLLDCYEKYRPLSEREIHELERVIPKQLAIEARYWKNPILASPPIAQLPPEADMREEKTHPTPAFLAALLEDSSPAKGRER